MLIIIYYLLIETFLLGIGLVLQIWYILDEWHYKIIWGLWSGLWLL